MLFLRPYTAADAPAIASWVDSERTMRWWSASTFEAFPLTGEVLAQFNEQRAAEPGVTLLVAEDERGPAGYLGLKPMENGVLRLFHIIVDGGRRGQGIGGRMLALALEYAFAHYDLDAADLNVFHVNPRAIACYEAAGFQRDGADEPMKALGETWNRIHMIYRREWLNA